MKFESTANPSFERPLYDTSSWRYHASRITRLVRFCAEFVEFATQRNAAQP